MLRKFQPLLGNTRMRMLWKGDFRGSARPVWTDKDIQETVTSIFKALSGESRREHELEMKRMERAQQREMQTMELEKQRKQEVDLRNNELMQKPTVGILRFAQASLEKKDIDTSVLDELGVKGFEHHYKACAFKCKEKDVQRTCLLALKSLPPATAEAVAEHITKATSLVDASKSFVFADGTEGQYNNYVVCRQNAEVGDEVAVAVLTFGMSFDCGKVVEKFENIEERVLVFEEKVVQVLKHRQDVQGWFGSSDCKEEYENHTERVLKSYTTKKSTRPVFKQTVMDAGKVQAVFDALELKASEDAVQTLAMSR